MNRIILATVLSMFVGCAPRKATTSETETPVPAQSGTEGDATQGSIPGGNIETDLPPVVAAEPKLEDVLQGVWMESFCGRVKQGVLIEGTKVRMLFQNLHGNNCELGPTPLKFFPQVHTFEEYITMLRKSYRIDIASPTEITLTSIDPRGRSGTLKAVKNYVVKEEIYLMPSDGYWIQGCSRAYWGLKIENGMVTHFNMNFKDGVPNCGRGVALALKGCLDKQRGFDTPAAQAAQSCPNVSSEIMIFKEPVPVADFILETAGTWSGYKWNADGFTLRDGEPFHYFGRLE